MYIIAKCVTGSRTLRIVTIFSLIYLTLAVDYINDCVSVNSPMDYSAMYWKSAAIFSSVIFLLFRINCFKDWPSSCVIISSFSTR